MNNDLELTQNFKLDKSEIMTRKTEDCNDNIKGLLLNSNGQLQNSNEQLKENIKVNSDEE